MNADFKFHPVGHGLFYSGVIKARERGGEPFTFVYDCGGKDPVGQFKEFWAPLKKEHRGIRLTLLVISHFHKDHISGVLDLIKAAKPKFVVMPYLSLAERVAHVAMLLGDSELDRRSAEELSRFILAPESCCEESKCRLYLINPAELADKPRDYYVDWFAGQGSDELGFPGERPEQRNGAFVVRNGAVAFSARWQFHFFMPKKAFNHRKIGNWLAQRGIDDGGFCRNISSKLFEEIEKKFGRLKLRNNGSNLVCMHGPVCGNKERILWTAWSGKPCLNCCWGCGFCGIVMMHEGCWIDGVSADIQVLTGDAEFQKTMPKEIANIPVDRCFLFQIPHHGSRNGWRDWFNKLPNCELRPVTHRWNCTYKGRPFMTDLDNLKDACHVTESPMSALNINMVIR